MQCISDFFAEKVIVSSAFTTAMTFIGADPVIFWLMLCLWAADFAFGTICALKRGTFQCRVAMWGVLKFVYYCMFIGIVGVINVILSRIMPAFMGLDQMPLVNIMMGILAYTDAVSILESMKSLNIPVPPVLDRTMRKGKEILEGRLERAVGVDNKEENK